VQLRVRQIPQQEVAEAALTSGADEEVCLRESPERQSGAEAGFVDVRGTNRTRRALFRKFLRGFNNIPAPAVAHSDLQLQPAVAAGVLLGRGDAGLQAHGERLAIANETQAHAIRVQLIELAVDSLQEQTHQPRHFLRGSAPVLAREGKERQRLDAAA
jgi:hypothetical protein